jgi:hypothetical protein
MQPCTPGKKQLKQIDIMLVYKDGAAPFSASFRSAPSCAMIEYAIFSEV